MLEPESESDFKNAKWVLHDKIGYIFPTSSNIKVGNITQTGSWSSIGTGSTNKEEAKVFSLCLNHGQKPKTESYQYIVVPKVTKNELVKYHSKLPIQVIENSKNFQAVRNNTLKITQIAFYQIGTLETPNFKIEVSQPCLIMIKESKDNLTVSAANPECSGGNLALTFSQKGSTKKSNLSFDFNIGSQAGFSQTKSVVW